MKRFRLTFPTDPLAPYADVPAYLDVEVDPKRQTLALRFGYPFAMLEPTVETRYEGGVLVTVGRASNRLFGLTLDVSRIAADALAGVDEHVLEESFRRALKQRLERLKSDPARPGNASIAAKRLERGPSGETPAWMAFALQKLRDGSGLSSQH